MSKLKLTRDQRHRLFHWRDPDVTLPTIVLPDGYEVERGREHRLSPYVLVRELGTKRLRDGTRVLDYELFDRRDPVMNLRPLPPAHVDAGEEASEPTAGAIERAAAESAYYGRSDPFRADESPPRDGCLDRYAREGEAEHRRRQEVERERERQRAVEDRLAEVREFAVRNGIDLDSDLWRQMAGIHKRIDVLWKVARRKATDKRAA